MTRYLSILILVLPVVAQELPSAPHGCMDGSCYPATGNLLIGRAINLTATSTCGLDGPDQYCIVSHLQESDKCFICDSMEPYDPYYHRNSHPVENVIYQRDSRGDLTWWQSVNGEEKVSIRLNLEAEFHFTHLIMKFKTFRPAAMLIERSADFGLTWRPYRYFAYNCTKTFPKVPAHSLHFIDEVICEERYSDIEPSTEGEVIYKVLDPAIHVKDPYSLEIQDLLRITNLRINFTKLHTLGDNLLDRRPDVLQKYYYALYELVVRGSCFCYGHALECAPVPGVTTRDAGMIHGRCVCKHNTVGLNCERCRDFYHDAPWRPAETDNAHTCRECNCNGHSNKCHFDMAVYLATGNVSGGVCDNCLHNTMGRNCETCKPFYYQDPTRDIRDLAACIPCDCDPVGSLEGGVCDSHTDLDLGMIGGQCRCKQNVRGQRCDYCKEGHYGLSINDPLGCQPCNCVPRGITMTGAPCDQISGDCSCKRYVTGRYCNQCLPEFWGLSNDLTGCRPCDCDFGGATSNRCMMDIGQCDCRPHLIGRQCAEVQPGYFCASLDYYKYEAEGAIGRSPDDITLPGKVRPQAETDCVQHLNNQLRRHRRHRRIATTQQQRAALRRIRQLQQTPSVSTVHRERQPGQMVTWTGPGFARVKDGAGLEFTISNIPYAMEYDIMIRYEPESTEDWEAIVSVTSLNLPTSLRCGNMLPTEQLYTVTMPHHRRYIQMPRPFCFEPNNHYVLSIRFQRHGVSHRHLTAFILIDSLVLVPKYEELQGFKGKDGPDELRRMEMELYMCLDSFMTMPMPVLAEPCTNLICSISAIIHNGALACECDPQGSLSTECNKVGGQCHCKPNVIGCKCDKCAPGTFGFGSYGCTVCDCHSQGSLGHQCDPVSGQCPCQHGAIGRQCSVCRPGQWGFPNCRPCQCNGHAESCDLETGECYDCRDNTSGQLCDSCMNGFYGNPLLGSGEHCRPCPCPGHPDSGHSNGSSCHADYSSNQILCHCSEGYAGPRCDQCGPGYYGNPEQPSGLCRPCQCSGNIDPLDPESCDPRTGQCLKCLYNTGGQSCSVCKPGYYGNALAQDCRRCTCVTAGTLEAYCTDGVCHCDSRTGQCPCKPNIMGHNCDQCSPNHWNFGSEGGCEPCGCPLPNALSTHCNMFSGQCQCQMGFGGRQCNECEMFHWGDPRVQCEECNCNPLGSEMAQCNRVTGVCQCKDGAAGRRCDTCARGFTGTFPKCVPCHPCFNLWDDAVCQVRRDLTHIKDVIAKIVEKVEVPGISDARIRDLEKKLEHVQDLIRDGDREGTFNLISQTIDDLRAEIAFTDGRLMGVIHELNVTAEHDNALKRNLTALEGELKDLYNTLQQMHKQLENYLTAGLEEKFENVRKYYQSSLNSELRCNASVYVPESPVEQSQDTRNRTEDLLKENKDSFLRTLAANNKSLSELDGKALEMEQKVKRLSNKVCGGHANTSANSSCPDSPCGGAGCRDNEGALKCGGRGCNGTVGASVVALDHADDIRTNLTAANEELQTMLKKLQDVTALTQNVKRQAKSTLDKAQTKKELFENSNKKLKEFIQKIRDFLMEEGADPESIEKVAQQVLAITLPVNRTVVINIVQQIKDNIANLTNVEGVFNQTSEHLAKVNDLLKRAHNASSRAERVGDNINITKEALESAQAAIKKAEDEMNAALENLNTAQNITTTVDNKLLHLNNNQMDVMMRLANLSHAVELLKNKTEQNREMAKDAKAQSVNATLEAAGLQEELTNAENLYNDLKEKVDSVGGADGNVNQKATDMKKEAEELLNKATKGMETLKKLERKLQRNEQKMQQQQDELADLEKNVTEIRESIRIKVMSYNNCQ
ncbi:laminin subunit beta-2 [Triplophysa rosa]|uniref:Laminin subunit beta-1 n=1 Tax=Triplophysa rosa TaxID=992332 RepID=A0A9W7TBB1_TRIRA|nr:laminin subunit beta-2 [Triplophysa rosa]XP_057219235.1 laminin subunit beta-2 [Triplophysa rosa]KAI7793829.1 putative laminin subunit beta-1 [Triplophysa rosa]